jgi:hypothetical protein
MQKLLKSPWQGRFENRIAEELFRGPGGDEKQGIGSGLPDHGRLPAVLAALLESEEQGDTRPLRQDLLHRAPMRDDKIAERWGERNSRILRSAGRIE